MNKWYTMPETIPDDDILCWVRINYWFGPAFKATYDHELGIWISQNGLLEYPQWTVCRWRPVV